jgi:hypothetical protein
MEPQYIASLIILGLGGLAAELIRRWAKGWETRMLAQDHRLDAHGHRLDEHEDRHLKSDIKLAVVAAELKYIKDTTDGTSADVKKLLQNVGTNRSTG